jgi:hypothetical protein
MVELQSQGKPRGCHPGITTTVAPMAHDEFPPLTRSTIEVLQQANTAHLANYSGPGGGVRPFAAAVICEAVKQAAPFTCRTTGLQVVAEKDLLDIAKNLHNLSPTPPTPPTREEMEDALRSLVGRIDFHPESQLAQEAAILAAGIAHHCKVQP